MIDNVLVPVIKSKTGRIMSKIITVLLHLLVLLAKLLKALFLIVSLVILILVRINSDSTGITAQINAYTGYVLKEIIDAYRVMNGSVFTCRRLGIFVLSIDAPVDSAV